MELYINKFALVAELERRRRDWRYGSSIEAKYKREECDDILSFLDTIEVKEVDLGESARHYLLQKIREEVARIQLYSQSEVLKQILDFIDSLQEEPVSEEFEEALAREWQGYNDRGAATVDALEDNTQELAFAKGFYRGWNYPKQLPVSEDLKKAIDESLAKNAEANDALQEGLRNGKKAVLIIGDDMPDYKCIFIPNGFSAKIEGNKVIFTKDKDVPLAKAGEKG